MPGSKAWRDAPRNIQNVADSHPCGFLAPLWKGGDPLPGLRSLGIRGREHGRRRGCQSDTLQTLPRVTRVRTGWMLKRCEVHAPPACPRAG